MVAILIVRWKFCPEISYIIPRKEQFTVPTSFRGEHLLNFSQPETRIAYGKIWKWKYIIAARFLPSFCSFDEAVPEEKMF